MRLEKDFWKLYSSHLREGHWQRVESPTTGSGIPDVNACRNGKDVWIENKFVASGYVVKVNPFQVSWHLKRYHAGGTTWIACGTWDGRIFVWQGNKAGRVKEFGLREDPDYYDEGKIDWGRLGRYFFGD